MMVIVIFYSLAAVSLVPILRAARTPTARRPTTLIGDAVEGLAHVARHPTLRGLAIAYSIYQMSWGVSFVCRLGYRRTG